MNEHSSNLPQPYDAATPGQPLPTPWVGGMSPQAGPSEEAGAGFSLQRITAALFRFKWFIALAVLVGAGGGYVLWTIQDPEYVANVTLFMELPVRSASTTGPITSGQLLQQSPAWLDLLRSYAVLDHVAVQEKLFLQHPVAADSSLFEDFALAERFRPGSYRIEVGPSGERYRLSSAEGLEIERGAVGDSVGLALGFAWQPGRDLLVPGRSAEFTISAPRDAARTLRSEVGTRMVRGGNFLTLELRGADPERITSVLNAVAVRFVDVAATLKRDKLEQLSQILEQQLRAAESNLRNAETSLESFRVRTITLPSDVGSPIAPGLAQTANPVFQNFFEMRIEAEQIRRDRERLEAVMAEAREQGLQVEALEAIGSVSQSTLLNQALNEFTTKKAEARALLYRYSPEYPLVQDKQREIQTLEEQTIPALANALLAELRSKEGSFERYIQSASADLRNIPARSIEEGRLEREVQIADNLYTNLQGRFENARLAAVSSVPDLSILDYAAVPQFPVDDTRIRLALMFFMGAVGASVLGALLLDRVDPKVRYPEQVTNEFGLTILGVVPQIDARKGRRGAQNSEQVLEAFRELRLRVMHAYGTGPVLVTITSPGSGEGKSLVSANLAVAFSELGHKTLLIDGDTRRGDVNQLLSTSRTPGLVNFLAGEIEESELIQGTRNPNLEFIGAGSRLTNSPELLASKKMRDFFSALRPRYSVIIVDSPPLGAGGDAYILGTLTGNLVMVLRTGTTHRGLTVSKLEPLMRLPIRVLGAILNDVQARGAYRYYYQYYSNYLPGYGPGEEGVPGNGKRAIASRSRSEQETAGTSGTG